MKKSPPFLGRRVKGYFSKQLTQLSILVTTIIIIIGSFLVIHLKDNYLIGYKYYEWLGNFSTEIGIVQQENFLNETMTDYLEKLKREGFSIASVRMDTGVRTEKTIVRKNQNSDEELVKNFIINHMIIRINTIKLNLQGDETSYYFNTKEKCEEFINKLNEYIKQEASITENIEAIDIITSEEKLNQKIENVKKEKELADQKTAAKKTLSSRSGYVSTTITRKKYNAPMENYVLITSSYGKRRSEFHTGVDFAAAAGTKIYSWKNGIVTFAGWKGNYGNFIIVEHEDGTISRYAHCSRIIVSVGDCVEANQTIGYVGTTGRSTGNHLHFEILVNGSFVNPLNYL